MGLRRRPRPTDGAPGLAQACVLGRWATRSRRVVHESAACSARGCANARNAIERTCEFECEARACQAPGKQAAQRGGRAHGCAIARNEHVADDDPSAVPDRAFLAGGGFVEKIPFTAEATNHAHAVTFMSNSTTLFRCVRAPPGLAGR